MIVEDKDEREICKRDRVDATSTNDVRKGEGKIGYHTLRTKVHYEEHIFVDDGSFTQNNHRHHRLSFNAIEYARYHCKEDSKLNCDTLIARLKCMNRS